MLFIAAYGNSEVVPNSASLTINPKDFRKIVHAADLGDANAAFRLGLYFAALADNRDKAIYYYRIAAKLGHPIARYNLGILLLSSSVKVAQDEGVMWLRRAAKEGDNEAKELLEARHLEVGPISNKKK
jgi:TPR repeat protein